MDNIDNMDNIVLGTHYEGCWRHMGHHACAVGKVEQLWVKVEQLCHELHDEQVRRDEWQKMYNQAIADQAVGDTEIEQLRERVEHWKHVSLKVAQIERSKQLAEVERLQAELAQEELTALGSATDLLLERLDTAEAERDKWRGEAHKTNELQQQLAQTHAELAAVDKGLGEFYSFYDDHGVCVMRQELEQLRAKLTRVRQDAQDQSDEVQELWLSPCEAEGLKRQLAKAEAHIKGLNEECDELYKECDSLNDRTDDAMNQIHEYDEHLAENLIQYAVEDVLERLVAAEQRDEAEGLRRRLEAAHRYPTPLEVLAVTGWTPETQRLEALAALVTPELPALLEKIASATKGWTSVGFFTTKDGEVARALAARIREALVLEAGE